MKMKLVLDVDKCCACGACAVACMDQNDIDIAHMTPFRRVADFELNGEYLYTSVSCTVMTLPAFKAARWASCARTLSPT